LNFERRRGAIGVNGFDNDVVERMASDPLLEFDAADDCARQTARLTTGKK
jgi:hypothetical protein